MIRFWQFKQVKFPKAGVFNVKGTSHDTAIRLNLEITYPKDQIGNN